MTIMSQSSEPHPSINRSQQDFPASTIDKNARRFLELVAAKLTEIAQQ